MNVVSLWEGNKQLICIVALKLLKNNITAVKNKLLNENSSLFHSASKSVGFVSLMLGFAVIERQSFSVCH